ncbi:uncharacterized protein J8A68_005527 [[Candida] subhashii]|uniref:Uncharacterized protein n=1 Tax=[Candida] subhashii TaxID=561895 RepID=A0A8J5UHR5_9ASCO|nr:uncharacterized protein J8A68_005527 [[Candida] subhashii]KAG7661007.1 hypothetical protein J8A68_005527 [[Candida] subhashii]
MSSAFKPEPILKLPHNVIQLIIDCIPNDYLEVYSDIPILQEFAARSVYRYIKIVSADEFYHMDKYQAIPRLEPVDYEVEDYFANVREYKKLRPVALVQLMKKYTNFCPNIVCFTHIELFMWFHKKHPEILKKLPRIDFTLLNESIPSNVNSFDFEIYNVYRVWEVPGLSNKKLFSSIKSLRCDNFQINFREGWGENLQELEFIGNFRTLPPLPSTLRKLQLGGSGSLPSQFMRQQIDLSSSSLPSFPLGLECLKLFICDFDELDISYLENLRDFHLVADIKSMSQLKLPLQIQRVALKNSRNGGSTSIMQSLKSLESYKNLREFRIEDKNVWRRTSVLDNVVFPQSLETLEINIHNFSAKQTGWQEEDPFTNCKLPPGLKVLQIQTHIGLENPSKMEIPNSLKFLNINTVQVITHEDEYFDQGGPHDWSNVQLPSLTGLRLGASTFYGIVFPESLLSLECSSPSKIKIGDIMFPKHLIHLKISMLKSAELNDLPPMLQKLDLLENELEKVIINNAPSLKEVELSCNIFGNISGSNFQLPDTVEILSLEECPWVKEISANVFPTNLRKLDLKHTPVSPNAINNIISSNYQHLTHLDLFSCKISKLDKLPPTLEWIRLDRNPISSFSPTALSELIKLKVLSMRSTEINGFLENGNKLVFPGSLISLDLSGNHFHPGAVRSLVLYSCVNLQELILVHNPDMNDVQILVDVVKTFCPAIDEFTLDGTHRERVRGDHDFICWSTMIEQKYFDWYD